MYTPRVLSYSTSLFKPAAAKVAELAGFALVAASLVVLAPEARANDFNTVVGAGIGAVAGAAIGKSVGGRDGAILGAGAGGLVGASIASQHHNAGYAPSHYPAVTHYQPPATYYQPQPQYHVAPPVTYYQPQPQYRVVQPITYYQPPVVVWKAPPPQYRHWREERRDYHHGHRHYRHHDEYRGDYNDYRR